jgi:predicted  nucleic acid-binding Zn-ribbon protein
MTCARSFTNERMMAAKRMEPTVKAAEQRVQEAGQRLKTADSRIASVETDAVSLQKRFQKLNADAARYDKLTGEVKEVQAQVTELVSRAGPCAETLAEYPAAGCAQEGTPARLPQHAQTENPDRVCGTARHLSSSASKI